MCNHTTKEKRPEMQKICNESYETSRLIQMADDWHRVPFIDAVLSYTESNDANHRVRLVETIIRTSRALTNDPGILSEEIKDGIMELIRYFQAFGPKEVVVPTTYGAARNVIKTYFF